MVWTAAPSYLLLQNHSSNVTSVIFIFFDITLQFQVLILCLRNKDNLWSLSITEKPLFFPKLPSSLLYLIWVDFQFQSIKTLMMKVSFVQRSKIHFFDSTEFVQNVHWILKLKRISFWEKHDKQHCLPLKKE